MIRIRQMCPAAVGLVLLVLAGQARAQGQDEFAEFQLAMNAYDTGEYATAEMRFSALLSKDPPLKNKALVFEIHKYLGATLMFMGREDEAEMQFEALLREDPEYEMDPVLFPTEVLDTFTRVKIRIADELAAIQATKALMAKKAEDEKQAKKKALKEKFEKASMPVYLASSQQERHVVLALMPFGIGQFQNGQKLKGWLFFGGETLLLATNLTLYVLTEYFRGRALETLSSRYVNTARSYWTATNILAGATLAAVLAGIIDALVFYVKLGKVPPSWKEVEESEVPPEVRPNPPEFPIEDMDVLLSFTFSWRM